MKKDLVVIIILVLCPVLIGIIGFLVLPTCKHISILPTSHLVVGNKSITAEIAATKADREKGLMYRTELPEDYGMLFVYPKEDYRNFWMKNTYLPLSIAFIKTDGVISEIKQMEPLSEATLSSKEAVRYALEMLQGWFRKNNIKPGDRVKIPPEIKD